MYKRTLLLLCSLAFLILGCSEPLPQEEVSELWQAKIIKVKNCDIYNKGDMFSWKVDYVKNNTFRTIYKNGPDNLAKTADDSVARIEDIKDYRGAKYLSDSTYLFDPQPEELVQSLGLIQIKESERNVGSSTNTSHVTVDKEDNVSFALHENGIMFYAHSDGGGTLEISGLDSGGNRASCFMVFTKSSLVNTDGSAF